MRFNTFFFQAYLFEIGATKNLLKEAPYASLE
jgi:hypothetical protein